MNNAGEELHPFLTLAGLQVTRKVVHLVSFCLQMYVIFLTSYYRVERESVAVYKLIRQFWRSFSQKFSRTGRGFMNFNKRVLWVPLSPVDFNSCSNFPRTSNWREFVSIIPIHRGFKMNLQLSLTLPLKMTSSFQSAHLNCPITKIFLYSLEESSHF